MDLLNKTMPPILSALFKQGFVLPKKIENYLDLPLRTYLKSLIPPPIKKKNTYYCLLIKAMRQYLETHNDSASHTIEDMLDQAPIIQQADHSDLLLNKETFLNNLLHSIACRENKIPYIITSQCSIVSCITSRNPYKGPLFLSASGKDYLLANFTHRAMKNSNFCTLPHPFQFKITCNGQPMNKEEIPPLLGNIQDMTFPNAETALRRANDIIWNNIPYAKSIKRISFDEDLVSELAAMHIEQGRGPLYDLLFNEEVRSTYLKIKRSYISSSANKAINLSYPDFFWIRKKSKLKALVYDTESSSFLIAETGDPFDVDLSPSSLITGLRQKKIYADRMISYLLRCLLPNVTALGGTSQQDYLFAYQHIFLMTHKEIPYLDEECLSSFSSSSLSAFGGLPLIETPLHLPIDKTGHAYDIESFIEDNIDKKLIDTIGSFSCASYLL